LTVEDTEVLKASGLVKIYGGKRVVDGVDMALRRKEIVGLLGRTERERPRLFT
jgi:ABC-type multidrug transport system ATPase subunit